MFPSERASIFMQNDDQTNLLCNNPCLSPRLSSFIDILTILLLGYEESNNSDNITVTMTLKCLIC